MAQRTKRVKRRRSKLKVRVEFNTQLASSLTKQNQPKVVKPYTRFQSQGHVKKWHTVAASLMLVACLVVEINN